MKLLFFRVMGFVQKVVARLDEKEKLDKLLEELGKAHFYYGAPKKYIDVSSLRHFILQQRFFYETLISITTLPLAHLTICLTS